MWYVLIVDEATLDGEDHIPGTSRHSDGRGLSGRLGNGRIFVVTS